MTLQCHICGRTLDRPRKCILCDEYICQDHSRSFEVGEEKSDTSERKIYAYVCDRCMEAVEELKKKPREEWTDEDKAKSKGKIHKILSALGKAGVAIVTAIFAFALWIFAKGENQDGQPEQMPNVEGDVNVEQLSSDSPGEASFTEETTFKEEESGVAM